MKAVKLKDPENFLEEVAKIESFQIIDMKNNEKVISLLTETMYEKFLNSKWVAQILYYEEPKGFYFYPTSLTKIKEFKDLVTLVNLVDKYKDEMDEVRE